MSTIDTTTDDAQTTTPLRFEVMIGWDRPLTHDADDPDWLKKRLGHLPVDGDVFVAEFTDTGATVLVETTPDRMNHSVNALDTKATKCIYKYNTTVIDGDDIPPTPREVKDRYVKWACDDEKEGKPPGGYIAPDVWEQACEVADGINLDGAPGLGVETQIRTLEGT